MNRDWTIYTESLHAGDRRREEKRATPEMLERLRGHWDRAIRARISAQIDEAHDMAIHLDRGVEHVLRFRYAKTVK
jgi:hypothetical protein